MKVYFFCLPHGPVGKSGYEHELVAVAEGFKELGIEPLGNVNYWRQSTDEDDYLIRQYQYKDLNEFDVVIFSSQVYAYEDPSKDLLPANLFSSDRGYMLVFVDWADGYITPGFKEEIQHVDLVLKSHYNAHFTYPDNFEPWQFGLTNRIIQASFSDSFASRNHVILSNFRISHHLRYRFERISRKYFYKHFPKDCTTENRDRPVFENKLDELFWEQTGQRHYPSYYKRLGRTKMVNAIGGKPATMISYQSGTIYKLLRMIDKRLSLFPFDSVFQFDSWRFWESVVSGRCTIHLDFEKYGMKLPVMPVNGLHYMGVDLDRSGMF